MVTRRFIMQKARRHRKNTAPTACKRMVSGTISLFLSKCFSPFPHGTGSLSVSQEYLALPDGPGGFAQDFTCPALLRSTQSLRMLPIQDFHLLWSIVPSGSGHILHAYKAVLLPQGGVATTLVWAYPRSLATTKGIICYFLFLEVLRCFSSLGLLSIKIME